MPSVLSRTEGDVLLCAQLPCSRSAVCWFPQTTSAAESVHITVVKGVGWRSSTHDGRWQSRIAATPQLMDKVEMKLQYHVSREINPTSRPPSVCRVDPVNCSADSRQHLSQPLSWRKEGEKKKTPHMLHCTGFDVLTGVNSHGYMDRGFLVVTTVCLVRHHHAEKHWHLTMTTSPLSTAPYPTIDTHFE